MYQNDDMQKAIDSPREGVPKFSFLRLMCRTWGKYVMKELFDKFSDKVTSILVTLQERLSDLVENFDHLKQTQKHFPKYIQSEFSFTVIEKQVLKAALQMVIDVSINEYSVKQIDNSEVSLSIFYPKLEDRIMKITKPFLKTLFMECSPESFKTVSQLYLDNLKPILIRRSQRRLHNLVYATICVNTENRIKKLYIEFSMNEYANRNRIEEDDEEDKEEDSPVAFARPSTTKKSSSFMPRNSRNNEDHEPEITPVRRSAPKEEKIVEFIQGIIKKSYLKTGRNSAMLRNNTHNAVIDKSNEDDDEENNIEIRYSRNTQAIVDLDSEDDGVEDEPKINLLRSNRSTLNPFMKSKEKIIIPKKDSEPPNIYERELSLAFYDYAIKNHKKLFDNLRVSYQEWKEGVDSFKRIDAQNPCMPFGHKTFDKRLENLLMDSLQLIRNNTHKDPVYDTFEPNYEDIYYKPFDDTDDQLRQFLLDEE
jgi:hypothetical protein